MMKIMNMRLMCLMFAVCAAVKISASDGVWTNTTGGNWSDTANWQNGIVAGGAGATASFPDVPTTSRVVVLPSGGVTLGKLAYNRAGTEYQMRFRGGPMLFDAVAPEIAAEYYFAIFYMDLQGTDGLNFWGGVVGTDTSYTGPTTLRGSWVYDYMHLGALSQATSISNYISTGPLVYNGGSLVVSGRPNTSASSSEWVLTAGDTLVRKVATALSASPGATVTGNGIPDGSFVKYNFDADTFELNQAATESGTNTLTFGAVSGSQSYQSFERIQMDASGTLQVLNNGGTLTRVDAGDLTGNAGTFTKSGDGTLAVSGGNSFGGALNLSGGMFESSAKDGIQPVLSNIVMSARTVFSVPDPATTSLLAYVSGNGELIKDGNGSVVMKSAPGADARITVENGSLTLTTRESPTTPVAGAWFHVDASDLASLTLVNENGTNFVTQWRDTRTNGVFASAVEGAPRPFLRDGFQNGLPVVDFGSFKYSDVIPGYGAYLNWSTACTSIREVFLVFSDTPDAVNIPADKNWSFLLGHDNEYQFHRNSYGVLFHPAVASPSLMNGGITVDGLSVLYSYQLPSGFNVVSLSPTGPVFASTFARDRNASWGGQRLAEVLVYDHVLEETQRRDVGAYLMDKWLRRAYPGYRSATAPAIGILKLNDDGVFSVGAGEELRVGALELSGDIVKNGQGTLTAEVIHETGGSLSVAEGAVAISAPAAADTAPASNPWFHVDANDPASLTLVNEGGINYVTQWRDTRTNGIAAVAASDSTRPTLVANGLNSLPFIDFGPLSMNVAVGQHLIWSQSCWALRSIFLVYSDGPGENRCHVVSHGGSYPFHRGPDGQLLNQTHASPYVQTGVLAIDGSMASAATVIPAGFHVVSAVTEGNVAVNQFAMDRDIHAGGQRLAEVLVYDRALSSKERRDTENYLSRKWLGVSTPGYAGSIVRMSGIAFTNDANLAVEGVEGRLDLNVLDANGALVKSGAGDVSVGLLGNGIDRFDVSGGLAVSGVYPGAWFHVDASDLASLTLVNENGTNFVTQWRDTRTNGVFASSAAGAPRPFLRDGFQNGLPVVDFGSFKYTNVIPGYGAYLNWSTACTSIREVFLVFSDTPDAVNIPADKNWSFLLGHDNEYQFHRNFYGVLFHPEVASPSLMNGGITVDGLSVLYSYQLPSGFNVVSLSPTGPVFASTFARDRDASWGGQRLAEVLIYTEPLSDSVKQSICAHLLNKWKDRARVLQSLRATKGSDVRVPDSALDIGTLEGAGRVSATRLLSSEVSPGDAAGEIGTLSVTATLELADGGVVTVDCAPPACDRIDVDGTLRLMGTGTFAVNCPVSGFAAQSLVLFTFSALEGAEHLAEWSVTGDILSQYAVRPKIVGNQLLLQFSAKGMVLLIR